MADNFREQAQELAPRGMWLRDATSQGWLRALGGAVGDTAALVRDGVLARFAKWAPSDALARVGDTRQIERAPREDEDAYRVRLARAWEIHSSRGTKAAYQEVLIPLGVARDTIAVWNDYEDSILPAAPGEDPWWSRVIVVVDMTAGPWSTPLWDDGAVWSDTEVWGLDGAIYAEIKWIRKYVRRWKWAGALPLTIVFIFGGDVWGLETVWSDSMVWSEDPADVAVMPLAHVWGFNEAVYGAPPDAWGSAEVWQDVFDFGD